MAANDHPDAPHPTSFEMVRRRPSPEIAHLVCALSGYRETAPGQFRQRETASLVVPLIISLGSPFRIALGRDPAESDRQPSFAAGLYAGPVHIESDGAAECIQLDFTPLGAFRFFGGAIPQLTARMVDIGDILGPEGERLRQRLGEEPCWDRRFRLLEAFVARRTMHDPSGEIVFAYRELARSAGSVPIGTLSSSIGWSRKHFTERFRREIGLPPKSVARMMRFHHACRLAQRGGNGWAMIAAESGYADQAHLVRDFAELAGETPRAWARRMAMADGRLYRAPDAFADW